MARCDGSTIIISFYLCVCMIFQETSTEMDVKTANLDILSMVNKSTDHG